MDDLDAVAAFQSDPTQAWSPPSADDQVLFLRNIQRILAEGQFVSTYKYALLRALADLAVLKGDDTGAALPLSTKDIAARFVELYWRQARPYRQSGESSGLILRQNTGKEPAIVSAIAKAQHECTSSLFRLKQEGQSEWSRLVKDVNSVMKRMPLWKLQKVGEERLNFLYENTDRGTQITLKPGVAYCFRAFYELIRDLIEGAWIRFVQRVNAASLGTSTDLGSFLFGQERACLDSYRPVLLDVQRGLCLYCQKGLSGKTQVDHFVPWSRYPADIGQNFVLAHERCNNAKSDHLAAEVHLATWAERNKLHHEGLDQQLKDALLPSDPLASVQIAKWVYQQTEAAKGQVWVREKVLQHLGSGWLGCL